MVSAKALLILHGKQATNDEVRQAVMARREQGHQLDVRVTWEGGDAERYVEEALNAGYDTVIAGGGDGSVRDITDTLMKNGGGANLGILPLGTANDFATAANIPVPPKDALALLDQPATAIDVLEVNGHYFLNMATGGFGTEVTTETSEELKSMLGGAAYLLTGLTRFTEIRSAQGHFRGQDFEWEGEFMALGVGNGRQAGGGQKLCPDAVINDGLMDVAILPAQMDLMSGLRGLFSSDDGANGNNGNGEQEGLFVRARLASMEIRTPEAMYLNLDGEPLEDTHFHIKVHAGALRVHLSPDTPLLS
ncbi:putative lipid kinase YegS-like protein [Alloalcanivorax dieselolei B5]|uniref:Probable lipid kinase YegS-like n=1 Tax=Alcanivorax dieselolei (strain DSM 16502 / CGMCC 1.3690 / MCCC 1A00001 / B-5) TaxID=930169 RepID=K0CK59_ALCDB|nr:lipid kinase YegS [Alloalcanivorax dieselolei]AFT71951.1 putative lipid kinase YegS-like protein [Alloalcanivorax dieselolei B5]GGK08508.1 putative lipid kinase YegS-like protein [Alloalcanivorax dieselolei]